MAPIKHQHTGNREGIKGYKLLISASTALSPPSHGTAVLELCHCTFTSQLHTHISSSCNRDKPHKNELVPQEVEGIPEDPLQRCDLLQHLTWLRLAIRKLVETPASWLLRFLGSFLWRAQLMGWSHSSALAWGLQTDLWTPLHLFQAPHSNLIICS